MITPAAPAVTLVPVDAANWRAVAALTVSEPQRQWVADPAYYLALCHYGTAGWQPLAVTGPDGTFEIANLPAGVELELQAWHERGTGRGNGLALDTTEAKEQLKWNNSGRFKIKLEENEQREIVVKVPASAVGA